MSDLFKDSFTGRIIENIIRTVDDKYEDCYEFTFVGTHKKLRINEKLICSVWVDDDKAHTISMF